MFRPIFSHLGLQLALIPALCFAAQPPIDVKVEESIVVSGQVVKSKFPGYDVVLKLQVPIRISNDLDFHDKEVFPDIGIYLGDPKRFPNPPVGSKGDFKVVIRCARVDCMVVELLPIDRAPQSAVTAQKSSADKPISLASVGPIPIDFTAIKNNLSIIKCQYMANQANGRVNKNGMDCIVQSTTSSKISSRAITYSKYDSQDVRMGKPYTLDTDILPGERVRIRVLGTEGAARIVFRPEAP